MQTPPESAARSSIDIAIDSGTSNAVVLRIHLDAAADPLSRRMGELLHAGLGSVSRPSPAVLESLAGVIAIHLARNYSAAKAQGGKTGLAPHKLEQVRSYIESNLADALNVRRLAALVHSSPFHFSRLFKHATGLSPHAYVIRRRLERAKQLLAEGPLPLTEVAASVGFQTQSHFTDLFRRHAGVTPRRFRLMAAACPPALSN
jgi:AraC family transcriptional regulator